MQTNWLLFLSSGQEGRPQAQATPAGIFRRRKRKTKGRTTARTRPRRGADVAGVLGQSPAAQVAIRVSRFGDCSPTDAKEHSEVSLQI